MERLTKCSRSCPVCVNTRFCEHTINMHTGRLTEKCLTFLQKCPFEINRGFFLLNTAQSMHLEEHSNRAF